MADGPDLHGRRVAVTRPAGDDLIAALTTAGAEVIHVPLIEIGPPDDGGVALTEALARLADFDWLVLTSVNGVRAVTAGVAAAPASVRLAAVGLATARELAAAARRPVDFVPTVARGEGLVAEFPASSPSRVLVAHADRAAPTVVDGLRARGHAVESVIAYATVTRRPDAAECALLRTVDAVVFASGSAVEGWRAAGLGPGPAIVAIGPPTAATATAAGMTPAAVAATPDVGAIVIAVAEALAARSGATDDSP